MNKPDRHSFFVPGGDVQQGLNCFRRDNSFSKHQLRCCSDAPLAAFHEGFSCLLRGQVLVAFLRFRDLAQSRPLVLRVLSDRRLVI